MRNINRLLLSTRLDRDMSRRGAAAAIGVAEPTLRYWETTDARPHDRFWRRISAWLEIPFDEVAEWYRRPAVLEDDIPTEHVA